MGNSKFVWTLEKLNATTKKDPYLLPFTNEVIDIVIGHEVYTFFNGFF
jgi:hypothetical protein